MAGPTPAKPTRRKSTPAKATPAKSTGARGRAASATAGPQLRSVTTTAAPPRVVLDLDKLTKQKAFPDLNLPKTPFTFLLAGVQYELQDPRDSDWKNSLALARNPFMLMRTCLVGADDPVPDPTEDETRVCRERHGLTQDPPPGGGSEAEHEAEMFPEGIIPGLIDRFTATHLPGWKLNALFENWHQHYKIDLSDGQGILGTLLGTSD